MAAALAVLLASGTLYLLLLLVRRLGAVLEEAPPRPAYRARESVCPVGCTCRGQATDAPARTEP